MVTGLSIVFKEFFYFFFMYFCRGDRTAVHWTPYSTCVLWYILRHPVFNMPYVIYIFVYTYTISDGNIFVNTFCKNNYVFFQVQYIIHIISSLTLTDRQIRRWNSMEWQSKIAHTRRWALALIYYYRSILCYCWGSTVKSFTTPLFENFAEEAWLYG